MQKNTLKDITRIYNKVKRLAFNANERGNYELSLRYITTAADIAYNFNWIYVDLDLEKTLTEISSKIISKRNFIPQKGRIVFYDVFVLDNRGLTQQYIRAIMSWGVELLFIFEGDNLSRSKNIVDEINLCPTAELFIVNSQLTQIEKIKLLYNKIVDFRPEKAFLHLHPSSALAVCLWNALHQTIRYMVNITDHAFWLGTSCIDYSIEFRNYGCTVSHQKRRLKSSQLLVQPYYPITECAPFIGFPAQIKQESIVILTGGVFYKMYGDDNIFFHIMKDLLDIDSRVIILIAGGGYAKPLNNFITKNNLQERLILIGNRPDINHVFENCDIYLSTFPIAGGLMAQFAAVNTKPILSYTSPEIRCNFAEGLLNWGNTNGWQVSHTTLTSFYQEAIKLIRDPSYRKEKGEAGKKHVIRPKEFNSHLKDLISTNKNKINPTMENINYDKFTDRYFDIENNYLLNFNILILSRFKFSTFIFFPIIGLRALFSKKSWIKVSNKLIYNTLPKKER